MLKSLKCSHRILLQKFPAELVWGIFRQCVGYIIFLFFLLYMLDGGYVERHFYVNEVFSLLGFIIFLRNPVVYRKGDCIYNSLLFYIVVCFFFSIVSLFFFVSFYGYLRNLVLFYSTFSFFLGRYLYQRFEDGFFKMALYFSPIYFFGMFTKSHFYVTIAVSLLPLVLWWIREHYLLCICILGLLMSFTFAKSTPIAVVLFWLYVFILWRFSNFKVFVLLTVSLVLVVILWMQGAFRLMGSVNSLSQLGLVFKGTVYAYDPNTLVRLYLWYQSISKFLAHPLGIGFGTPLFCVQCIPIEDVSKIPILPYVLGSHNSYLYVLVRMGILGGIGILSVVFSVFYYFFRLRDYLKFKHLALFFSLFGVMVAAALNVVLESPVCASAFWLVLGMVDGVVLELKVD